MHSFQCTPLVIPTIRLEFDKTPQPSETEHQDGDPVAPTGDLADLTARLS